MKITVGILFISLVFISLFVLYSHDYRNSDVSHNINHQNSRSLLSLLSKDYQTISCNITSSGEEVECNGDKYLMEKKDSGIAFWRDIIISIVLVLFAGTMSGLTMGLMSMSVTNLNMIIRAEGKDAKYAKKILPLVKKHHLLLVTLLLGNAIAMEVCTKNETKFNICGKNENTLNYYILG
eukprot:TRINITY_DN3178_c0_g1_i1.p1 TRINITY_DN3178_c0_g1~~TRINITY_DN3178_c0_g1_i1.p1  ORF type:complete len:207 (+),score=25.85 TRINITY_DN3178_c0_g1_i1:82-621(+)